MKEFYHSLKDVELPSCFKRAVITRACAVLEGRRKSLKREVVIRHPKPLRPMVCITSGFFITAKGRLFIPLWKRNEYAAFLLTRYVQAKLAGKKPRSLTITPRLLSFCYSEEVEAAPVSTVYGVDRNEKNISFGHKHGVIQIDLGETVRIKQTTREIIMSFKRKDARVRRWLASKYWKRTRNRTNYILHAATNFMLDVAAKESAALALEDLTGIRKLYQKGSGQSTDYRFRLNSWPYDKIYRILDYKSAWRGITMIPLTKAETYSSSSECASCGERLHDPEKGDAEHRRMLWCQSCKMWVDRDANAAVNLSNRGLARFASSLAHPAGRPQQVNLPGQGKGLAGETLKGNEQQVPILRVDASKLSLRPTKTRQNQSYSMW
jgi:putative transposase